jgi:hypothetical protein
MAANLQADPKIVPRASITRQRGIPKAAGTLKHHDYRVVFASGVDLEISNCRCPGLARLLAVDYQRSKGRQGDLEIVRTEQLPHYPRRHRESATDSRVAAQGTVDKL